MGRNYAAHRREMGGDDRDPPFFFAKPADAIVPPGRDVAYPPKTANLPPVTAAPGTTARDESVAMP